MFNGLKKLLGNHGRASSEEDWPSIVLLLREADLPTDKQALEMARAAWGAAGPVELVGTVGPHNFAIRASTLFFALHAVPSRYAVSRTETNDAVKQCWNLHSAWFSVDMPNRSIEKLRAEGQLNGAYLSLMHFVGRHWSQNVLAMYFPAHGVTVPNHGELIESIRWARRSGLDLTFLKK